MLTRRVVTAFVASAVAGITVAADQPARRVPVTLEGFRILVDDRLVEGGPDAGPGREALRFLESRLGDVRIVVPADKLEKLRKVTIVLDKSCGDLRIMQYHPSADWLESHGYPRSLEKCVHIPEAADLATRRTVAEQPWVVLHELAHAYHDQVLGFDEPRIRAAWKAFEADQRPHRTLLYDGSRVKHYGLTDHKEFFAEMTEAWFGMNDFHPFNRAEMKTDYPDIHALMADIWGPAR